MADEHAPGQVAGLGAVRISGHAGKQGNKMGLYVRSEQHSTAGAPVYTLTGNRDCHLFRGWTGWWFVGSTANMHTRDASPTNGGNLMGSCRMSPLGSTWWFSDDADWCQDTRILVRHCAAACGFVLDRSAR